MAKRIQSITIERIAIWLLVILAIAITLAVVYLGTPFVGSQAQIQAIAEDPSVELSSMDGGYVLSPGETAPDSANALVFYPGAAVDPSAYLSVLAPVVNQTGMTIYIPRPRLNLAILDQQMADPIIDSNPGREVYVGGHSLGGVAACRFASSNPDRVSGLVLWGSYCDRDLSGRDIRVLSVRGSGDTVIDWETYRDHRSNLPANQTVEITVEGMNHTQFGTYSGQWGDSPASISYERAHEQLRESLRDFLNPQPSDRGV